MLNILTKNSFNIDFAFFDGEDLKGSSLNFSIQIKGEVDKKSGVILDFTFIKEIANEIKEELDHKIIEFNNSTDNNIDKIFQFYNKALRDRIVFLRKDEKVTFKEAIVNYVEEKFRKKIDNRYNIKIIAETVSNFGYIHFISNSYTKKCRRIHGHSFDVVTSNKILKDEICKFLDGKIIIKDSFIDFDKEKNTYSIKYKGYDFLTELPAEKFLILNTEPTIENIYLFLRQYFSNKDFSISEGFNNYAFEE